MWSFDPPASTSKALWVHRYLPPCLLPFTFLTCCFIFICKYKILCATQELCYFRIPWQVSKGSLHCFCWADSTGTQMASQMPQRIQRPSFPLKQTNKKKPLFLFSIYVCMREMGGLHTCLPQRMCVYQGQLDKVGVLLPSISATLQTQVLRLVSNGPSKRPPGSFFLIL